MFDLKGFFLIPAAGIDEDKLLEIALEAGADDVKRVDDTFEVTCSPDTYGAVSAALEGAGVAIDSRELTRIPKDTVPVDDVDLARRLLKLMERLDDHDDVQNVSANFDIPDEVMAEAAEE
jgi:transcriptional/translational regulatory protein YebC/TACO1